LTNPSTILVTGGTGFVGAYVIRQLVEHGYIVRAIRRSSSKLPSFIPAAIVEKVHWVNGDVLDIASLEEAMEGAAAVIHSAAMVSFEAGAREEMLKVNIEGTANVVNIAIEKNIARLVHISSVAALGRTANEDTVNEERQWTNTSINTNYAISKYKAEIEVWRAIAEGMNAIIINPSTILGYGDWNTSSCAIFKSVYEELPYYTEGINGFVYVEDVARAVIQLLNSDITGERFIANGENWTFRQMLFAIADGFGKKRPHRHVGPALGALAWRLEKIKSAITGKRSLITRESARIAQSKTFFDNSKILKNLPGFQFTPLEDAIKQSCLAYLQNLSLK
jgi:nucleoside-diphosphate-sugar epimerase